MLCIFEDGVQTKCAWSVLGSVYLVSKILGEAPSPNSSIKTRFW